MARRRGKGRRRFRKYLRGNIDEDMSLGVLAAADAVLQATETVNGRTFVSSVFLRWAMAGWTVIDGVGPILVGVAHSDYTAAEIEAWIEQTTGSWNEGDLVEQEVATRKIRKIGIFEQVGQSLGAQALNDGKPIRTKLGWVLNQGQGLSIWAYNLGTGSVATTDPTVHANGHANLWPNT